MQESAVPELAHARTRPVHWVATAAAVTAVIAGSSLLGPDDATAAPAGTQAQAAPAPRSAAPDPQDVDFPLDCGPVGVKVHRTATGDLDGDGRPETVAAVRCDAGLGNPPDALYVITAATGADTAPRVVAALTDVPERRNVADVTVREGVVRARLLGYSSQSVPSCCPDEVHDVTWRWQDGSFRRSTSDAATV